MIKKSSFWISCFFIFIFPNLARSQYPHTLWFHPLTGQEGLSHNYNWYVYHDTEGFVWVSSLSGLNRFDGINVKTYNSVKGDSTSLLGEIIYSEFFEDKRQNIWFSTPEAIHCYVRQSDNFQRHFLLGKDAQQIRGDYQVFFLEKDTFLWVGTGNAIYTFNIHQPTLAANKVTDTKQFRCKMEVGTGGSVQRLFVYGVPNGLEVYNIRNRQKTEDPKDNGKLSDFFSNCRVRDVLPENNSRAWLISDKHGLVSLNFAGKGQWHVWGKFDSNPIALVPYRDRHLLLVTRGKEMLLFDKKNGSIHPILCKFIKSDERATQSIAGAYLDQSENLWIVDENQGLHFANLHKTKFRSLPKLPSVVNTDNYSYWSIKEDKSGNIWVGTSPGGIFLLDKNGQLIKQYAHQPGNPNSLPTNGVRDILPDHAGNIWVATSGGLVQYDPRRDNFRLIPAEDGRKDYIIGHLHQTKADKKLLISTENGGIFELKETKGKKQLVNLLPAITGEYQTIFEDKNGWLYCVRNATEICVFRFENDKLTLQDSFPVSGLVNGFYEDEQSGTLYFATSNGLVKIDKNNTRAEPATYSESNGLPGNFIGELLGAPGQKLWLGTNKGLAFFDGARDSISAFGLADGVQSLEFHITAALQRRAGDMWFGGSNGITIVPSNGDFKNVENLPKVIVTGVKINDGEVYSLRCRQTGSTNISQVRHLVFPHHQNTISFEFVAAEYSDPENNRLAYRLYRADGEPYDASWVHCPAATGFARYSKLSPGKYVLNIRAANSDGIWNPQPRLILVEIRPPFTQTKEFYALCAFGLLVVSYFIMLRRQLYKKSQKLREQRLQLEKQEALTQERNRIAGEMHDDLGGGLTSIRMLSNRVQKKITDPDIQTQVDKIAEYSQELVQKMGEIIWAMNSNFDTLDNLIAYIRSYAVRYLDENNIRCIVQRPDEVPDINVSGERRRNLYLAVKESLHNIVKHAEAERVNVQFHIGGVFEVRVQDNGKGIDPEQINQFGNGLYNMKKRLESIGGSMDVQNHEGTLLIFKIPLKPE
jgi:signal transduction histidine kinase/ligand-binding sensor domain-containing protein